MNIAILGKDNEERVYYLYSLICPIENIVRYIGITHDPKKRLSQHVSKKDVSNPHKLNWISCLREQKLKPTMEVLYCTKDFDDIAEKEIWFISEYRALVEDKLTNVSLGGASPPYVFGDKHWMKTDEGKERMSVILKERYKDPANRQKMSESMKGIKKSNTENIKAAAIVRSANPEWRKKISEQAIESGRSAGKNNPMYGKKRPEVGLLNRELFSTPVVQFDRAGNRIKTFPNAFEAAQEVGVKHASSIRVSCREHSLRCRGFYWRYEEDAVGNSIEIIPNEREKLYKKADLFRDEICIGTYEFSQAIKMAGCSVFYFYTKMAKGQLLDKNGNLWRIHKDE